MDCSAFTLVDCELQINVFIGCLKLTCLVDKHGLIGEGHSRQSDIHVSGSTIAIVESILINTLLDC